MRKVVVTGGSGRLGQFVIHDLLAHGFEVSEQIKLCVCATG